ncbi:MAG TPA: PIN domain-containing protein [Terriglobales bacterium]|nr:PIN domain-containing protein [Terriglobales bacterium]
MIYVDSSVLLAALFAEDRIPPKEFWQEELISSRLAEYEVYVRLHAPRAGVPSLENARTLLRSLDWLEMTPLALARALEPFPRPLALRTPDALHLASALHLRQEGFEARLATYDRRLAAAARAVGLDLAELPA